jgi:hypothetical protein
VAACLLVCYVSEARALRAWRTARAATLKLHAT